MNKGELKKFAVEARRDLLKKVSLKAEQYGITKEDQTLRFEEKYGELVINGRSYPMTIKNTLKTMESKLKKVGYEQFIEEVAYTWFNRITAIRYMEVNGHLPERVNVLSSTSGKSEPDIVFFYETMSLDIKKDELRSLLNEEEIDQAYRKLFVAQCNALNKVMPFLFERIEDYTELLLPDYLLDQESVIRRITNEVSEDNFYEIGEDGAKKDNVEILGWLYQYYMSEKKEKVGGLKSNAVKKEDLPIVTQLFTPKWIVQYMVQNSLGKLYDEKYEDNNLSKNWEYYLKHEENHHLYPEFDSLEELKIIDPACGSGHILLYAFDMLFDMYQEAGYPSRDIPQLILEHNLYGLDIDKRAQQIANFALLMKAVEKQPRLLSRLNRMKETFKMNVYEIIDADRSLSEEAISYFTEDNEEKIKIKRIMDEFNNGKQFGSLIIPPEAAYKNLIKRIKDLEKTSKDILEKSYLGELKSKLLPVLMQARILYEKYDVTITNPPYHNKYNLILKEFVNAFYKDYSSDLYSAFIYRLNVLNKENGYSALMTPYTWMYISTHEKLRSYILENTVISSLVELEYSSFKEATVPICTFITQNQKLNKKGVYLKLTDFKGEKIQPLKVKEAAKASYSNYKYYRSSDSYRVIPGNPLSYWITENASRCFENVQYIGDIAPAKKGLDTNGDSKKFFRYWFEVVAERFYGISKDKNYKWIEMDKGGGYKKWYGNKMEVINYENNGYELKNKRKKANIRNENFYNKKSLTYGVVSSSKISFRYSDEESIFDQGGPNLFPNNDDLLYILALGNSKVYEYLLKFIAPTLNFTVGDINKLPVLFPSSNVKEEIIYRAKLNLEIAYQEWKSFETAWEFEKASLLYWNSITVEEAFNLLKEYQDSQIKETLLNEKIINEFLVELYDIKDEVSLKLSKKDITLVSNSREESIKELLSYFLGCLMGRYSLDIEKLVFAGGNFNEEKYKSFKPNKNGLVTIMEDEYFENDIIVRLKEFLSITFSKNTVDENLEWLAEALTIRKNETPEERLRRYFMDEFFKDHCKTYQKRPIYWLVDSGKQKGLRTLIYMHRYQPDTMATIRFEHLQEIQSKYQNEIEMLDIRLSNPNISASDRRNLEKLKESYQKKIEELQEFDKKLAVYANNPIDIDLDDGVKVNYAKFDDVLAKIK